MRPSQLKTTSIVAATATILTSGLLLFNRAAIKEYYRSRRGTKGIIRYIWLGDYLEPHLRQSMNELDKVEVRIDKSDRQLEEIEILIERARLESVDGSTTPLSISQQTQNEKTTQEELTNRLFQQYPKLRTQIGIFSNKLDTLAACIDDIQSHADDEVKTRKKGLSNRIVDLMNGLDTMIASLSLEVQVVD